MDPVSNIIPLSGLDLSLAALLVVLLAVLTTHMKLGIGKRIIFSALRMIVQLLLIGLVLRHLFQSVNVLLILFLCLVMLLVAGREIRERQQFKLRGISGYSIGLSSMVVSTFTISIFSLVVIIGAEPWYAPRYSIPLLGMLLGNSMTAISLASDRLTADIYARWAEIEQRLCLGETGTQALKDIKLNSMRTGMIPIINSMAAAGIVSLPGTMTGQILGGSPPIEAVKYQILILLLIAASIGFGVSWSIWLTSRRLFDKRQRLRLEQLVR